METDTDTKGIMMMLLNDIDDSGDGFGYGDGYGDGFFLGNGEGEGYVSREFIW